MLVKSSQFSQKNLHHKIFFILKYLKKFIIEMELNKLILFLPKHKPAIKAGRD